MTKTTYYSYYFKNILRAPKRVAVVVAVEETDGLVCYDVRAGLEHFLPFSAISARM